MQLQLIYRAQARVNNRYGLCSELAKVARCLHPYSASTSDAIMDALVKVGTASCLGVAPAPTDDSWAR
jgi:hypothetical protein